MSNEFKELNRLYYNLQEKQNQESAKELKDFLKYLNKSIIVKKYKK